MEKFASFRMDWTVELNQSNLLVVMGLPFKWTLRSSLLNFAVDTADFYL